MDTIKTSGAATDALAKTELAPKNGQRRVSWLDFMPLLLFICLAYGAWLIFQRYEQQTDKQYTERSVAITTGIPVLVERIRHVEDSYQDMQPAVMWSGEGAKILLVEQREGSPYLFGGKRISWTVLARTPKGRFFSVDYVLFLRQECEEALKCADLQAFRGLTETEARVKVFRAGKRDLYRELFGEDMPPTEIKA